jgi:hypothetical protein
MVNSVGPQPAHVLTAAAWPKGQNNLASLVVRARRERAGTVTACGAPTLARPPPTARPARGGGAGRVSTRGLRERRGARFWGGILTEAMAR